VVEQKPPLVLSAECRGGSAGVGGKEWLLCKQAREMWLSSRGMKGRTHIHQQS
jgi:hypothetical protein